MKQLFSVITLLALVLTSHAQIQRLDTLSERVSSLIISTGEIKTGKNILDANPTEIVDTLDDGYRITMLFDCVNIVKIRSQNGKKKLIWLWFNQTHDGGYPSFPVESFCLEKPLGANVVINIEQMDYVEYLIDMAAAEEHAFPNEYKPLKPIGNYEGFYPDEPFNISTISYTPTTEKFKVRVIPVSYNQATQIIRIPSKIVFSVKFTDTQIQSLKKSAL
ncbi:MAG: hypothetical protein K2H33_00405 [Muribaculaceae bacterium]|nr:hypothetical protein [Muribaculaceae bacterium]MDE6314932.1 hypothetical protein [Muribaculaceae bacterium]